MKMLKEKTLEDNQMTTPSTSSSTSSILAVLAIGVCVFFTYQAKNKKQDNDRLEAQHEQKKATKATSYALDLMMKTNLYNKWLLLIGRRTLKTLSKTG